MMSEQSKEQIDRIVENAERCIKECQGPKSSYAGSVAGLVSGCHASLSSKDKEIERLTKERDEVAGNYKGIPADQARAIIAQSGMPLFIETRYVRRIDHNETLDRLDAATARAESAESRAERLAAELEEVVAAKNQFRRIVYELMTTADGKYVYSSVPVYYPHHTGVVKCETMCSTDGWVAVASSSEDAKRIDYDQINVQSCYSTRDKAEAALAAALSSTTDVEGDG